MRTSEIILMKNYGDFSDVYTNFYAMVGISKN